jgi:hypothetical protein
VPMPSLGNRRWTGRIPGGPERLFSIDSGDEGGNPLLYGLVCTDQSGRHFFMNDESGLARGKFRECP